MPSNDTNAQQSLRGRDPALTWEVPAELELERATCSGAADDAGDTRVAVAEWRSGFKGVAEEHLTCLVRQLVQAEQLDVTAWVPVLTRLAGEAAAALSPAAITATGDLDPRRYVKVKRLPGQGGSWDSWAVHGVVCRKNVAHRRMRTHVEQPRIMLLGGALECQRSGNSLSSFDMLIDQEKQYLEAVVARIAELRPDVLVVEQSVARHAQDLLLEHGVALVLNIKRALLDRLALCTGAQVAASVEALGPECIGSCEEFEVDASGRCNPIGGATPHEAGAAGATAAAWVPPADATPIMTFRGCPSQLTCTVLLCGDTAGELSCAKRILKFAIYAAYWNRLESSFLADQLLSAAAAVAGAAHGPPARCNSGLCASSAEAEGAAAEEPPELGSATAEATVVTAQASYEAAIAARGNLAITSASPHTRLYLEPGAGCGLELPGSSGSAPAGPKPGSSPSRQAPSARAAPEYGSSTGVGNGPGSGPTDDQLPASLIEASDAGASPSGEAGTQRPGTAIYGLQQLWLSISCKNPGKSTLCEPPHLHSMEYYGAGDLALPAFLAAAAPANRKCPHPQCGDGAVLHLRSFVHGDNMVTLSSIRLPAARQLPGGDEGRVWMWLRPLNQGTSAAAGTWRLELSPESACLSFAHLLDLLLNASFLSLGGLLLQRDFVRYIGRGSTLLCLHTSRARPYEVAMPPPRVTLLGAAEASWVQGEVKDLAEEADEAFSVMETAGGDGQQPHPDEAWRSELREARHAFMDAVHDIIMSLDLGPNSEASADPAAPMLQPIEAAAVKAVWQLGQLRRVLAWLAVQWGSSLLQGRQPEPPPAAAVAPAPADRAAALETPAPGPAPSEAPPMAQHWCSGATLGQQSVSSAAAEPASAPLAIPRSGESARYWAPTLHESLSSAAGGAESIIDQDGVIPTGLVARYVALFDTGQHSPPTAPAYTASLPPPRLAAASVAPAEQPHSAATAPGQDSSSGAPEDADSTVGLLHPSMTISLTNVDAALLDALSPKPSDASEVLGPAMEPPDVSDRFQALAVWLRRLSMHRTPSASATDEHALPSGSAAATPVAAAAAAALEQPDDGLPAIAEAQEMAAPQHPAEQGAAEPSANLEPSPRAGSPGHFEHWGKLLQQEAQPGVEKQGSGLEHAADTAPAVTAGGVAPRSEGASAAGAGAMHAAPAAIAAPPVLSDEPAPAPAQPPAPPPQRASSQLRGMLEKARRGDLAQQAQSVQQLGVGGSVRLAGRSLLPAGIGGLAVTVYDDEPTSIISYFLTTRPYHDFIEAALAGIQNGAAAAAFDAAQPIGDPPPGAAPPAAAAPDPMAPPSPALARRHSTLDEELSLSRLPSEGQEPPSWRVLFSGQQLDCRLAVEDISPGMELCKATLQVTMYYAPQFAELRRQCVAGGERAFVASLTRCLKWSARGGKSSAYFAKTRDDRYIVKQLSRSERQSFLEFAPDYFRHVAAALAAGKGASATSQGQGQGQPSSMAKVLGMFQVSVSYSGAGGRSGAGLRSRDGTMDLVVMENIFYGRSVERIFDLKGSERDRYVAEDTSVAGAVLMDENLKRLSMAAPMLVGPHAYAGLQRALWADTGFLSRLGVMDYSLLVGVDRANQALVVGLIDYIRQYTWDKQVETWVKKSGLLGGAGKDPTVISPRQYSRRFRTAMASYLTLVPGLQAPPMALDPDLP